MALISAITHLRIAHQRSKKDFLLLETRVIQTRSIKTYWESWIPIKDLVILTKNITNLIIKNFLFLKIKLNNMRKFKSSNILTCIKTLKIWIWKKTLMIIKLMRSQKIIIKKTKIKASNSKSKYSQIKWMTKATFQTPNKHSFNL